MVSNIEDPLSQHDHDVLPCEHEADAHYHYRFVEHPLQEPEKWENARRVVSGERFADKAYRSWASGCINQLDLDIAAAEEHIRRLERHCARLRRDRLTLSSSLAPIRVLPQDILLEVFSSIVRDHGNTVDADAAPWIFLRVCHRWRLIAQSSPFLWSTITVTLNSRFRSSHSGFYLKLVEHSLSASRQVPLSVSLHLVTEDPGGDDFATDLITTLSTHRARIRVLIFCVRIWDSNGEYASAGDVLADAFFDMANACPMLEKLDIPPGNHSCGVRPALNCAPNLRRVRDLFPRELDDQQEPLGAFSNRSLTHFSRYTVSLDNISSLGRMPHLKELHLFVSRYVLIRTPQTPIKHSGVRYFNAIPPTVLDHLTLPSLEVLSITRSRYYDFTSETKTLTRSAIEALISRSKCVLRALVVTDVYVTTSLLDIQGIQHLDTLAIHIGLGTIQYAQQAILTIASSRALPKLKRLILLHDGTRDHHGLGELCTDVDRVFHLPQYEANSQKIEKIEMWNVDGALEDDLIELLSGLDSKDSRRKWEPRLYYDATHAFGPPLGGVVWHWLSDIIS